MSKQRITLVVTIESSQALKNGVLEDIRESLINEITDSLKSTVEFVKDVNIRVPVTSYLPAGWERIL